jgi:hypothetical protein
MLKKFLLQGCILFALAITPLHAANVSVLVIESGIGTGVPAVRHSVMWENALMDVFFDAGHIVSNAPIMRLPHRVDDGFPGEAEKDFDDAQSGGIHFFIVAVISHPAPHNVSLRLFSTGSQQMLFEQQYTDRTYRTSKEENDAVRSTIASLAQRIR